MPNVVQLWDAELGYTAAALESRPDGGQVQIDPSTIGGAEPLWGLWATNAGGSPGVMIMPHSIFEWRSAEYGIDPDDWDTLFDVILHHAAVPNPGDPMALMDPGAAAVLEATHGLPTVFTPGVSEADRLAAARERVRLVKQHILRVEPAPRKDRQGALDFVGSKRRAPADPLAPIKTQARIDPIRVAGKRAFLDWHRASSTRVTRPRYGLVPPATFVSAAAV
ncbi:hypothetical protein GCM10009530_63920 [Microbispora corallina]|uniref:Uncharacterized protein n=1 Tax=Microbispora corallina TaxID=83302 RepID=A0ABQ4GCF6_9ACTN|nr:hypothetical protein [Microbispora corallina]GIH44725.1 hypothetical protein Mco01_77250 [Microbispora corallina]